MTYTLTSKSAVESIAQHAIDNHPRQQAATILAGMYNQQWNFMETAMIDGDWDEAKEQSAKLVNIALLAKQFHIYRDMMVAVASALPAKR